MLMGALAVCGLPTLVAAQQPMPDPVPYASAGMTGAGSAFPGSAGSVMQTGYQPGMMPPGMGGMPGMPPGMGGMGGMPPGMMPTMQAPESLTGVPTQAPLWRKEYNPGSLFPSFNSDGGHLWVSFGWKALQRGQLQNHLLAVRDPNPGFDAGVPLVSNLPAAIKFSDTPVDMSHGFTGSIGFYYEDWLWEISGWALPTHSAGQRVFADPGSLSSYFFNVPFGFEGTNGFLWGNADVMSVRLDSTFYNVELNTHFQGGGDNWTHDMMIGARYMNITEKLHYFTSDDAIQIGPVPFTDALLVHRAQNNLLGLHVGLGSSYQFNGMFGVSWEHRGGVYANLMDVNHVLQRGDGFFGFDNSVQKWDVAASYETGAFFHVNGSFFRVKAGYEFKWLFNVATAENQFDFDLQAVRNKLDTNGTLFYHGPTATLDIMW
jgi:hypothetical protein